MPEETKEYSTAARHLYLGQLVHENPAVEEGLFRLGLGDVAKDARSKYAVRKKIKSEIDVASRQPHIPGLLDDADEQSILENKAKVYLSEGPKPSKKLLERADLADIKNAEKRKRAAAKRRSTPWNSLNF